MEAFESFVRRLVKCLNSAGLDYMFTGALAASYYGMARTTSDVDVIVAVKNSKERRRLVLALRDAGLKADEKKVDDAVRSGYGIATFCDGKSPLTVDVILREKELVKRRGMVVGLPTFFQAPEDLILAKLRMIKATFPRERALKDREDVRAILRFADVDVEALEKQAERDSTLSILKSLSN
ncbi:MAG: hypothetical protein QHH24_07520 [Candidatus Bathyarchaeota archaeon]|nr:hypothetical protein [Candidatus Bathyarchaeota archaeon]